MPRETPAMNQPGAEFQPLRISVFSQYDPAKPRADSIADFRLCAGLAAQGHSVELVVPSIVEPRQSSSALFVTYDLEPNFDIRYLAVPRRNGWRDYRIILGLLRHNAVDAVRRNCAPIVISHDVRLLLPYLAMTRIGASDLVTAIWLHDFRGKRLERLVCTHSSCILATNSVLLRDLASRGISDRRTFVTGNPVPQERVEFGQTCSRADARRRLGLDLGRPLIAYTGKLYLGMRELDYLLTAASHLPEYLFLFTGGQPPVIKRLLDQLQESGTTNVRFTGMLSDPGDARFYQQAADVLVAYYSVEDHALAHHQLPNKLAEYMSTGNPIVSADFPAVRDVLNPGNAVLVKPDDVNALTEALIFAVSCPEESASLARRAQRDIAARTTESVGGVLGNFLARASRALGGR
jgi:glycosyltransferase involved in cell wall biosynthesis